MKRFQIENFLTFLFSLAITCIAGEFVVRYTHKAWPFHDALVLPSHMDSDEAVLRWRFTPGNGLNNLGLRNREITRKGADTCRVIFLGDSLIWSSETASGELYTEVIEKSLNKISAAPQRKIEIINAGIPGYTTYQELEFLKIHGLDMEPDLVILGFVFNDLYYKYLHRPTNSNLLDSEPDVVLNRFDPETFLGRLLGRSYLAHDAYYVAGRIINKLDRTIRGESGHPWYPFEQRDDFYLAWKAYGWRNTRQLIDEMKQTLENNGASMEAIVFPISDQMDDSFRRIDPDYLLYPQHMIGIIFDDLGIPYIDLTIILHNEGGKQLYRDYVHLNKKGNSIVARELKRYLLTSRHYRECAHTTATKPDASPEAKDRSHSENNPEDRPAPA